MSRRTAAIAIVLVWLGTMGWLVQRQYLRPRSALLADAALRIPPGATYFSLELGGQQIGIASNQVDTLPESIRVDDRMQLEIPALGTIQRVEARTEALLSRALELQSFTATLRGDDVRFGVEGVVSGDSLLVVTIETAESRQTMEIPLDHGIVLPALLPLHVVFGSEPEVGQSYTIPLFDPLLLRERDMQLTITAESTLVVPDSASFDAATQLWVAARWDTLQAWRVSQNVSGISVDAWIDELGQVVEAESPVGFSMRRTAFEIASQNFRRRDRSATDLELGSGADIIRRTAIASNVELDTGAARELRVVLGGLDPEQFDLSGGRQILRGDTLIVTRETEEQLQEDPNRHSPDRVREIGSYLQPEPLIQSRDPRIEAQARQIVGRRRNPVRRVELLNSWVYENIEKRITVSVPSALEVLESRRGDCNEHTVLFVALARAQGIPARTAAGLVHIDGNFYYHAWPEVWLNGWVAVDPTLGQLPADATHLRFTIGGLARQVELIQLIGRLNLEVLSIEQ
ncbi:MAG: lasso peptide biosynthesis protein [Gemmatimonadota bacterium]|nr:MAG: lasso peptide biosynthesis protein [Gemmatimonadota bacterium]